MDADLDVIPADDPEFKKDLTVNHVVVDFQSATGHLLCYFSSWMKLKTSVAWLLKVKRALVLLGQKRKELCAPADFNMDELETQEHAVKRKMQSFKTTLKGESLTPEDLERAEQSIIQYQYVQEHKFKAEIASLNNGCSVSKESPVYRLDPVMDNGILRVGGRLDKAAMPAESKHPVILSKDLHVSVLILRHIHHQLGHAGRNHMLSRLRQRYWILSANSAARKVISDCVVCRRNRGKLVEQKMADLPEERVLPDRAPFSDVGVDYFGPIDVKKRWRRVQTQRLVAPVFTFLFVCFYSSPRSPIFWKLSLSTAGPNCGTLGYSSDSTHPLNWTLFHRSCYGLLSPPPSPHCCLGDG